jgi:hypothetical protein
MDQTGADAKLATQRVALQGSTVHIGHLEVPLDQAAEYMRGIPAEKWELAFVHAVQVGMTEIMARRRRFQMDRQSAPVAAELSRAEVVTPAIETRMLASVEPVNRDEELVAGTESVLKAVEEKIVQPRVSPPHEPSMEIAGEHSGDNRSNVEGLQVEPDGWLRRLDEDFEILDQV